jgi:hypothetical protein
MDAPDLPAVIRETVRHTTDALQVSPPPWPELRRRHQRARRVRQTMNTLVTACAFLAVAASLGPGRDLFSAVPIPAASSHYLGTQPLGRLAQDTVWSEAMLQRAATEGLTAFDHPDRVVFADDVAGSRVALVRFRNAQGTLAFCWYTGDEDAPASAMTLHHGYDAARAYGFVVGPSKADNRHATVLVVGPGGATMTAWTNNDVATNGQQISNITTGVEIQPGVYTTRLAVPFPQVVVRLTGLPGGDWRSDATGAQGVPHPPRLTDTQWWARSSAGARGHVTSTPPPGLNVQQLYDLLALRSDIPGARVLWVQPGTPTPEVVLALRAPAGGLVLVAHATSHQDTEAVRLHPAGTLDDLAFAWHLTERPGLGQSTRTTTRLGLLGPPTAASARITAAGTSLLVPLTQGATVTEAPDAATVDFLGPRRKVLATTVVAPPWRPGSGVLGQQR